VGGASLDNLGRRWGEPRYASEFPGKSEESWRPRIDRGKPLWVLGSFDRARYEERGS